MMRFAYGVSGARGCVHLHSVSMTTVIADYLWYTGECLFPMHTFRSRTGTRIVSYSHGRGRFVLLLA